MKIISRKTNKVEILNTHWWFGQESICVIVDFRYIYWVLPQILTFRVWNDLILNMSACVFAFDPAAAAAVQSR